MIKTNLDPQTAFLDLTKPENLKRMKIEKELVPYFCNLMEKMQNFFAKKGLINANNYALLFEEYLLTPNEKQFSLSFAPDKELSGDSKCYGTFSKVKNEIEINSAILDEKAKFVEAVICHEFIHFLTMTTPPYIKTPSGDYKQFDNFYKEEVLQDGVVFNEAYTDMLADEIYLDNDFTSYIPEKALTKQYNYVARADSDYFSFLRGYFPGKKYESNLLFLFKIEAEIAFKQSGDLSLTERYNNENYTSAQDYLIYYFSEITIDEIERFRFLNVEHFIERMHGFYDIMPKNNKLLLDNLNFLTLEFASIYYSHLSEQEIKTNTNNIFNLIIDNEKYLKPGFLKGNTFKVGGFKVGLDVYTYKEDLHLYDNHGTLIYTEEITDEKYPENYGYEVIRKSVFNKYCEYAFKRFKNYGEFYLYVSDDEDFLPEDKGIFDSKHEKNIFIKFDKEKAINEKEQKLLYRTQMLESLNANIDIKTKIASSILKSNKNTISVLEIAEIENLPKNDKVFLVANNKKEFNFYYWSSGSLQEIKKIDNNCIELSFDGKKSQKLKVNYFNRQVSCLSVGKTAAEDKFLQLRKYYIASDESQRISKARKDYQRTLKSHEKDF